MTKMPGHLSLNVLTVGKPYDPSRPVWPQGADYNFQDGGHELRIFLPQASKHEVEAVESGKIEFGLIVDQPDLFVAKDMDDDTIIRVDATENATQRGNTSAGVTP